MKYPMTIEQQLVHSVQSTPWLLLISIRIQVKMQGGTDTDHDTDV